MKNMRFVIGVCVAASLLVGVSGCNLQIGDHHANLGADGREGVFLHISHGPEDPHRVLMALTMADLMADSRDVLVYFDIKGVEVVLKDAATVAFEPFKDAQTLLPFLIEKGVHVCVCPGCLRAAGKTPEDVMDGVQIADKDKFFDFTTGRILTLDY